MGIVPKKCIKQLVCETEKGIRQLNINQQEAIRYIATKNIQQSLSKHNSINKEHKQEIHTVKQIKQKQQQGATIPKADKGKTMVIIYKQDLDEKVNSFITNNIIELKTDPMQKIQRTTENVLKLCKNIIDPAKRKDIIQMNPQAPKLKAKIKIHKPSAPIRPVIHNIYAPTHKVAKHI
jgi:hypothetical protein